MQLNVGNHVLRVAGRLAPFRGRLSLLTKYTGLHEITLTLEADEPAPPPELALQWDHPVQDIQCQWYPANETYRGLPVSWTRPYTQHATSWMPMLCLHNQAGKNRLTFACGDALNVTHIGAGVVEETAQLQCTVRLFVEAHPPIRKFETKILLDLRDVPYYESLKLVADWWAQQPGYTPAAVPEAARLPTYSTWYSFHQQLSVEDVVRQCRLSKELGCASVIVDDGWQTLDSSRGYAFTGDWEPERIPDMRGFVRRVHDAGLKFLLWYAVPFIGVESKAFARLKGKLLRVRDELKAGVIDPRFPEVREYLLELYERHLRQWDLDGFKLDFVDMLTPHPEAAKRLGQGRDFDSVSEAADKLMSDIMARLRGVKPDLMIEFRQSYVGPLMRKYGNMFRAGDCPNDALGNRRRTLDLRLTSGHTAVHSDMLMWNPGEPVEAAALQLLNVLFAVPQISVLIDKIPADHQAMLRFYLQFWRDNRDALLDGILMPLAPESGYRAAVAETPAKRVVAIYDDGIAPVGTAVPELHIVNATRSGRVVVENEAPMSGKVTIFDCTGKKVSRRQLSWGRGVHALPMPPAGLATVTL